MNKKLKKAFLAMLLVIVGPMLVVWGRYRIPASEPISIEGEIHYKMLDISGDDAFIRSWILEPALGNQQIHLANGLKFYLSEKDYRKIRPVDPRTGRQDAAAKYAILNVSPLLFGGYGVAKLESIRELDKDPIISK